jgi:hypothetical protein
MDEPPPLTFLPAPISLGVLAFLLVLFRNRRRHSRC